MVYKQGVNRVANDEVFPYYIKCWYDNNHVYLLPLKIPTYEEIRGHSNNGEGENAPLWLVLENKCRERRTTGRGKFFKSSHYEVRSPIKNLIYTFNIPMSRTLNSMLYKYGSCYITLRGSYRFGSDSSQRRTGINSNTIVIHKEI